MSKRKIKSKKLNKKNITIEERIIQLGAEGKGIEEIAEILNLTTLEVSYKIFEIGRKLGLIKD